MIKLEQTPPQKKGRLMRGCCTICGWECQREIRGPRVQNPRKRHSIGMLYVVVHGRPQTALFIIEERPSPDLLCWWHWDNSPRKYVTVAYDVIWTPHKAHADVMSLIQTSPAPSHRAASTTSTEVGIGRLVNYWGEGFTVAQKTCFLFF